MKLHPCLLQHNFCQTNIVRELSHTSGNFRTRYSPQSDPIEGTQLNYHVDKPPSDCMQGTQLPSQTTFI
jgi:hypothetical protein